MVKILASVAGLKIRNIITQLFFFQFFDYVHCLFLLKIPRKKLVQSFFLWYNYIADNNNQIKTARLAGQITQIVQFGSAHLAAADNLYLLHMRGMKREYPLHAAAMRYPAHGKGLGDAAMLSNRLQFLFSCAKIFRYGIPSALAAPFCRV